MSLQLSLYINCHPNSIFRPLSASQSPLANTESWLTGDAAEPRHPALSGQASSGESHISTSHCME